jgi:hypothetical protein
MGCSAAYGLNRNDGLKLKLNQRKRNHDKMAPGKFTYAKSLGRHYDSRHKVVKQVTFAVSQRGRYQQTLLFDDPVTVAQAIELAEAYLSEPITPDYVESIKDDLTSTNLAVRETPFVVAPF